MCNHAIILQNWSHPWFSCIFQMLCWPTARVLSEKKNDSTEVIMFHVFFNISLRCRIMKERDSEKETVWQTEGGERGRILLWQPFHSLWMTFFSPLSILWDFKASISVEWFGPTIVWILNIHQGLSLPWGLRLCWRSSGISQYIAIINITVVDMDIAWYLVGTWVSRLRWIHTLQWVKSNA